MSLNMAANIFIIGNWIIRDVDIEIWITKGTAIFACSFCNFLLINVLNEIFSDYYPDIKLSRIILLTGFSELLQEVFDGYITKW